jgi:hypothetical protein
MALGGVIGGILGSAVGGPLGASIGTGAGQLIQGAIQKKKAQGMSPSPVDVGRQKLLNDLYRMQQARKTGTAYNPQIAAGKQMAKSLSKNAFAAGGPVNQGMYSNLMSQTMNNITQQSTQDVLQGYGLIDKSVEQAEKRKFDITSLAQTKMEADAAQNQKAGFQNLAAGLMPKGQFTNPYDQDVRKKKKKNADVDLTEQELDEDGNPIND